MDPVTVYIGFNPELYLDRMRREIRLLIRAVVARGMRPLVPKEHALGDVDRALGVGMAGSVRNANADLCVFATPSVGTADGFLVSMLDEACKLRIKSHGFVFKSGPRSIVSPATFQMFYDSNIEVANAVYSHRLIMRWIGSQVPAAS